MSVNAETKSHLHIFPFDRVTELNIQVVVYKLKELVSETTDKCICRYMPTEYIQLTYNLWISVYL